MGRVKRFIYKRIIGKVNPVRFAKKIGVNITGTIRIYGHVTWGTEPWIISLGDNVHITDSVKFITHDGGTLLFRNQIPDLEITKPIVVGNNVYIGNNAMILPGVAIGNNVVIGAGSIVTKDIPNDTVVAGVPAKRIESTEEYLEKLKKESLHLGDLKGREKDKALMEYYSYVGGSKGIYF